MEAWDVRAIAARAADDGAAWQEFLRVPALSAGVYRLPARGEDHQEPHSEDEIYYVVSGRATIRVGDEDRALGPGAVVFVAAGEEHRFHSIEEELTLLVVFAPAEYSRAKRQDSSAL